MDYIGIDLHKEHSQICVVDAEGQVLLEVRIKTSESTLEKFFAGMAPAKILLEASGMSEWAARVLEGCGHEVVVGDTNYGLMYSARNPKVKTDARDAQALAQACRLGLYRAAYRATDDEILMRRLILAEGCSSRSGRNW